MSVTSHDGAPSAGDLLQERDALLLYAKTLEDRHSEDSCRAVLLRVDRAVRKQRVVMLAKGFRRWTAGVAATASAAAAAHEAGVRAMAAAVAANAFTAATAAVVTTRHSGGGSRSHTAAATDAASPPPSAGVTVAPAAAPAPPPFASATTTATGTATTTPAAGDGGVSGASGVSGSGRRPSLPSHARVELKLRAELKEAHATINSLRDQLAAARRQLALSGFSSGATVAVPVEAPPLPPRRSGSVSSRGSLGQSPPVSDGIVAMSTPRPLSPEPMPAVPLSQTTPSRPATVRFRQYQVTVTVPSSAVAGTDEDVSIGDLKTAFLAKTGMDAFRVSIMDKTDLADTVKLGTLGLPPGPVVAKVAVLGTSSRPGSRSGSFAEPANGTASAPAAPQRGGGSTSGGRMTSLNLAADAPANGAKPTFTPAPTSSTPPAAAASSEAVKSLVVDGEEVDVPATGNLDAAKAVIRRHLGFGPSAPLTLFQDARPCTSADDLVHGQRYTTRPPKAKPAPSPTTPSTPSTPTPTPKPDAEATGGSAGDAATGTGIVTTEDMSSASIHMNFTDAQLKLVTLPLLKQAVAVKVGRKPEAVMFEGRKLEDATSSKPVSAFGVTSQADFVVTF